MIPRDNGVVLGWGRLAEVRPGRLGHGPGWLWPCPRRPGREGIQGRGHRSGTKSDSRRRLAREMPHPGPIGDEDAGKVTPPGGLSLFSGLIRGVENTLRVLTTPGGGQSTQRGRHCCPTRTEAWTSHGLCDEVSLPSRTSDPSVTLRRRSLITPHTPGRLVHGHSLPGPWTRRPPSYPGRRLGPWNQPSSAAERLGRGTSPDQCRQRAGQGLGRTVCLEVDDSGVDARAVDQVGGHHFGTFGTRAVEAPGVPETA